MFEVGQRVKATSKLKEYLEMGEVQLFGTVTVVDEHDEEIPYKVKFDNEEVNDDAEGTWTFDGDIEPLESEESNQ